MIWQAPFHSVLNCTRLSVLLSTTSFLNSFWRLLYSLFCFVCASKPIGVPQNFYCLTQHAEMPYSKAFEKIYALTKCKQGMKINPNILGVPNIL